MNTEPRFLRLDEIEVPPNRLRDADPDRVKEMIISLRERGQLQDIEVLPVNPKTGKYPLNIGLHRFLAAESAGLDMLSAKIFSGTALEARLREIDENLYRHELTALDQAVFLAERRTIYEQMHGIVRRGGDQRTKGANLRQRSFFDDTTNAFGFSRDIIKRALTRFSRLTPEVRRMLSGTKIARIASEIDALSKLPPEEQFKVATLLTTPGGPLKVAAAIVQVRGGRAAGRIVKSPFERMQAIWNAADPDQRRQFVQWLLSEGHIRGRWQNPKPGPAPEGSCG